MAIKAFNIGTVLSKTPERVKRPLRDAIDGIFPNSYGLDPEKVKLIQRGLLKAVDAALEKTKQNPEDLEALGTSLERVNSDLRSILKEKDRIIVEVQKEVANLAGIILALAKSTQSQ